MVVAWQSLKAFEAKRRPGVCTLAARFSTSLSSFTHRLQLVAAEGVQASGRERAHAFLAVCVYMCLPTYACVEKPVVASFKPVSQTNACLGESTW